MATQISVESSGLSFYDPSVDPQLILDSIGRLVQAYGYYSAIKAGLNMLNRFPSVEYAVGFDGVDDHVSIPGLEIGNHGLEIEANIWISRENQGSPILSILDSDDERILTLVASDDENFQINAFYKNADDTESQTLHNIKIEEWQKLNVESDGEVLSINVDGDQEIFINQINLGNPPFELDFGRVNLSYFNGMVRNLEVNSGNNDVFSLKGGKDVDIEDKTNSAVVEGVHNIRKGRLEKEFK